MHFLDSLDDHGFSEEEMRLTIEYGMNCHVRSLLDSLCDGDLSSKSDDEAYDLFDWLNRESKKPNFSLLLSIEENTIVDVDEVCEPLSDDVVDDVVEQFDLCEFETMSFHDHYELGEPCDTLCMDESLEPLNDTTPFEDVFSREEECVDLGDTLLDFCDANHFDSGPCWDEHIEDSWEAQVDAIEAALNGSGSSYLEFCEFELSESELVEIEAALMDEMAKSEKENHGGDTFKIVDLAISSPLFYPLPSLQPSLTHTYDSFEGLDLHFSPTSPTHFEKKNDVLSDFRSVDLSLVNLRASSEEYDECKKPFQCGNTKVNLGYPFYDGQNRPSYCGYPGFQIDCGDSSPEISMSSDTYYVLGMNLTSDTVTVASQDYFTTNGVCPQNLNINSTLFKYASTNDIVTIFYGCPGNTAATATPLPCRNASNNNNNQMGYYTTQSSVVESLNTTCHTSVVLPILPQSSTNQNTPSGSIQDSFQGGFGLEWIAENKLCNGCHGSGGLCGSNATLSKFTCYCSNGSFDSDCKGNRSSKSKTGLIIGVLVGGVLVAALVSGCIFMIRRRKRLLLLPQTTETTPKEVLRPASLSTDPNSSSEFHSSQDYTTSHSSNLSPSMPSYPSSKSNVETNSGYYGVNLFSYAELEQATNNFTRELGDGGFGAVYYGELRDGRAVAVKRLFENSIRRMGQFMNEVKILARLRHDNLVILYGCTSKTSRDLLLVYEYIPNGTVADHLHGNHSAAKKLTWPIRLSIAVETAEALSFLHNNDVIHRDVKTTNILLDNKFKVKVADFGLSRLFPNNVTHVSTAPQGTPGYVDPDYYQCYRLTEKSDVYSFGVVLIELISSKTAVDVERENHDINLAMMAVDRIQKKALSEIVDPHLGYDEDYVVQKMVKLTAELAFLCLQHDREMRPSMKEVLESLKEIQKQNSEYTKQIVVYIQESDEVGLLKNAPPVLPESYVNYRM
ncbi:hypothetical protein KSS87_014595 [Heliosperma pusillum]|nr:hypothetical protein KSS87_014595 [Heliosperma pusillum]